MANVIHFERGGGLGCAVNLAADTFALPDGSVTLLRSDAGATGALETDVAAWYVMR